MRSRFVPKRDEVVLSTIIVLLVGGLVYQGLAFLSTGEEHIIFQKNALTKK